MEHSNRPDKARQPSAHRYEQNFHELPRETLNRSQAKVPGRSQNLNRVHLGHSGGGGKPIIQRKT